MPIAVLTAYTEQEYEPFDSYSRFYPAMPISVCFSDTALCTLGKSAAGCLAAIQAVINSFSGQQLLMRAAFLDAVRGKHQYFGSVSDRRQPVCEGVSQSLCKPSN